MKRYENYIFDLYGTLVDIWTDEQSPALWRFMAQLYSRYGADYRPGELKAAYFRAVREEQEKLTASSGYAWPEISLEAVFLRLYREAPARHACLTPVTEGSEALWLHLISNAFRSRSMRRLRLYPNTKRVLAGLKAKGSGLYLLSNAQRCFTLPELELLGIRDYFDAVYISSDYAMAKPQPEFLECLLREQELRREDCVMVGNDMISDMGIAGRCGVDGIFLNTDGHSEGELQAAFAGQQVRVILSGDLGELESWS